MGVLYLNWMNILPLNPNVIAQRGSKRVKTVGGAFSTSGFTPANDFAAFTLNMIVQASVTDNKVYEFKLENICSSGGPTISANGIQENICFACISPDLGADSSNVTASVNLAGTDITKVRFTLKQQSDNLIVGGPTIVNNVADAATITFTGLAANTGYYVTIELYATINGIDVISSSIDYLGSPCGGNTGHSQITTESDCRRIQVTPDGGPAQISWTTCDGQDLGTTASSTIEICTDQEITIVSGAILTTDVGAC